MKRYFSAQWKNFGLDFKQMIFPEMLCTDHIFVNFKMGSLVFLFFFNVDLFIYLFIYFWLCWVFVAARGLSLVAASGGCSSLRCAGFSLRWPLLLRSTGSRHAGFSSCSTWAQQLWVTGSRAQAKQLWHTGLVAPQHVGSSWTRARTRVPCIGRWILNHCTTREVLFYVQQCVYVSPNLPIYPSPPHSFSIFLNFTASLPIGNL